MIEEQLSLWGEEFTPQKEEEKTKKIIKKAKNPKKSKPATTEKIIKSKKVSFEEKIATIKEEVYRILGKYADDTQTIRDYDTFKAYIDAATKNGIISIDTETNNTLNTFDCKLMGLCLYTPGQKHAYIPINHTDISGEHRLDNQLTENQVMEQLKGILDNNVFEVYHNATFDIEVLQTTCGIRMRADWDTLVGAQLLNENEHKSLKGQYVLHIDPEDSKYDIENLFQGLPYNIFPPELFALYAATDSFKTYKLYEYQREEFKKPDMKDVYKVFKEIEIPVIDVIVDMELTGITVDTEYAKKMSDEYHKKSDEVKVRVDEELENLKPVISKWRLTPEANAPQKSKSKSGIGKSKNQQLADPVDLGSPTQLAILLYDILKAPVVKKDKPRSTDSDVLEELSNKFKICKLMLEKRGIDILINTFIDKIPQVIQKDGRVHARFNQCGTQTGRFSSSDPNLQNIPSHDKAVRMMFIPSEGHVIIGGDYSGQEPRSLCAFAQDKAMQEAYREKKDLYAVIASKCFHNNYEDNLEFPPSLGGKLNPEGKERRSKAKKVFLGVSYGMGSKTLADSMELPIDEAKQIINDFYKGFPGVDKFTKESQEMARKYGYVTDLFGRRRHLPDATLSEYEITPLKENSDFNPLLDVVPHRNDALAAKIADYKRKLEAAKWKSDKDKIVELAKKDNLNIKNNSGFISRATRQTLNARIQGSAASMTKLAMVKIHNDARMREMGFQLLITVHDEVLGEVKSEYAEEAAKRLCELMVEAAKVKCSFTPWSVDPYIVYDGWYEDECGAEVLKDYRKFTEKSSPEEALESTFNKYLMLNKDSITKVIQGNYEIGNDSLKYGPNYFSLQYN